MFSFSTENWSRSDDEVRGLMAMFAERIDAETPELHDEGVRMRFIGRRDRARGGAAASGCEWAEESDGGERADHAVRRLRLRRPPEILDAAARFEGGREDEFASHLYAPEMHDPDLLIRTSGEQRISNYLLWQCAYSEFVFRDELWPDFTPRGLRGVTGRVRDPPAALRRSLSAATARPLTLVAINYCRRACPHPADECRSTTARSLCGHAGPAVRPLSGCCGRSRGSSSRSRSSSSAGSRSRSR